MMTFNDVQLRDLIDDDLPIFYEAVVRAGAQRAYELRPLCGSANGGSCSISAAPESDTTGSVKA